MNPSEYGNSTGPPPNPPSDAPPQPPTGVPERQLLDAHLVRSSCLRGHTSPPHSIVQGRGICGTAPGPLSSGRLPVGAVIMSGVIGCSYRVPFGSTLEGQAELCVVD